MAGAASRSGVQGTFSTRYPSKGILSPTEPGSRVADRREVLPTKGGAFEGDTRIQTSGARGRYRRSSYLVWLSKILWDQVLRQQDARCRM